MPDITQRVALAVVARSPIERLVAFKKQRGWHYLPLFSDTSGEFSRDYHGLTKDGGDDAAFNVFTRRRRQDSPFLERRDGWVHGRSRPGPARGAGSDAALDDSGRYAGGAGHRLVSEAELLGRDHLAAFAGAKSGSDY